MQGFASFGGQRNWPDWWWFSGTGEHFGYEPWVERDVLMALDADPDVDAVALQPTCDTRAPCGFPSRSPGRPPPPTHGPGPHYDRLACVHDIIDDPHRQP